jgi:glycosyltransferase involved in cell wall biosynthesis
MGIVKIPRRRHIRKAADVLRREGVITLLIVTLQRLKKQQQRTATERKSKVKFAMLVKYEDVVKAQWSTHPYKAAKARAKPPYTINWVMSPPGPSGGGHQNIFRFIRYLEDCGHTCRVYIYSANTYVPVSQIQENLKGSYNQTEAAESIQWLKGAMAPADAVFATGWETAYAVFNDPGKARKFYFVQDFEPYFYPMGSEYVLAENTYRFNFFGITAGGWLDDKLSKEYGMQCGHYEFGADTGMYRFENKEPRKEVFFYARPVTARRGFELGVMALQIFHEKMPEYIINFAGWDVSEYDIPFPYKNLTDLKLDELSDVYNRCAAGLVISLTNMSLLPLEVLACGMIPVVTDGQNNRLVSDNPYIAYAPASPDALAQSLVDMVTKKDLPKYAEKAAKSVSNLNWGEAGRRVNDILKEQING